MANIKKPDPDKRLQRCVTLSDNEIENIKKAAGQNGLSKAIRYLAEKEFDAQELKRIMNEFQELLDRTNKRV